jgi:superfamily I DNA/RNA helicase
VTRAWLDLCQKTGQLRYSHGAYLKMWELSGPVIDADYLLWDEAQDVAKVMESIVLQQKDAQVVAVGDANQAIYEWMGAIDALTSFERRADHVATLTQSFRSGQAIAEVANVLLGQLGSDLRLQGHDGIESAVTLEPIESPAAVLCRTNAVSVRRVIAHRAKGQRVALVGDGTEVLRFARAARELQERGSTSHPDLACFMDWASVQSYVLADALGGELRLLVNLVDEFGVPVIEAALSGLNREDSAQVVVSTAHKAKGRQWSTVALADDFPVATPEKPLDPAEIRLQYVAATRAQHVLDLSACPTLAAIVKGEPGA